MEYRRLGRTDVQVSAICLGTMTWGRQNTEAEGHAQMDYALERGVNFWDTAEMYAIPPIEESYGSTEKIIGNWFASRGGREKVVLASKAIGRAPGGFAWVREGKARLDRENLVRAVEDSLTRLKTDYIDLYQFHWPDRTTARFGARGWTAGDDAEATPIDETLRAADDLVRSGKVRFIGLSNETPWGTMTFLRLADELGLPRIVSVQNAYNLLNRTYEDGLAEVSIQEGGAAGLFSAGCRDADRQISGWRDPARHPPSHRPPQVALRQGQCRSRRAGLSGYRQAARPGPGASGAGLRQSAALRDIQHHRRHLDGAPEDQHRFHRCQTVR